MGKYAMEGRLIDGMMDWEIVADCLEHLSDVMDQCSLHKVTKRTKVAQAAYGVAKVFGHRSAFHDLYLDHPSMTQALMFRGVEDAIPISGLKNTNVHYRLTLLGRESKRAATGLSADDRLSGNSVLHNQIEVNCRASFKYIYVQMDLTPHAFHNLCTDLKKPGVAKTIIKMVMAKWGSAGDTYNIFEPTQAKKGGEGYRYVRLIDGVPKIYQPGWGWMRASG